jgi:tripartite-type tricarboxylate transporter receptor subunit TctC
MFAAVIVAEAFAASPAVPILEIVSYPNRPVRIVVPWPAAGAADVLARTLAEPLEDHFRQRVSVENRPGAGGNVGSELVAKSAPDGYTLLVGAMDTHVINPVLYGARMPFRGLDDFQPVSLVAYATVVLAIQSSLPARSVTELIALAKARPGQLRFATAGEGSNSHLLMAMFGKRAGIAFADVPYKGSAAAVADVAAGNVDLVFNAYTAVEPFERSGKLRVLAVTAQRASSPLPAVPPLSETLPGFELVLYYGLFAPRGTHRDIVDRLNLRANAALQSPVVRARLAAQGLEPARVSAAEFENILRADSVKWAREVAALGLNAGDP